MDLSCFDLHFIHYDQRELSLKGSCRQNTDLCTIQLRKTWEGRARRARTDSREFPAPNLSRTATWKKKIIWALIETVF